MEYYSLLSLRTFPEDKYDKIRKAFESVVGFDIFINDVKAYELDIWTKQVSEKHPEVLIEIQEKGEDSGDISKILYLKGEEVNSWYLDAKIPDLIEEYRRSYIDPDFLKKLSYLKEALKSNQEVIFSCPYQGVLKEKNQIRNIREEYSGFLLETPDAILEFKISSFDSDVEGDYYIERFELNNTTFYIQKSSFYNSWNGVEYLHEINLVQKERMIKDIEIYKVL